MKRFYYLILGISIVANIILGILLTVKPVNNKGQEIPKQISKEEFFINQEKANNLLRQLVC